MACGGGSGGGSGGGGGGAIESRPRGEKTGEKVPLPTITSGAKLGEHVGRQVILVGRVSKTPWQHLMGAVDGKQPEYFDPKDGGAQTVVHLAGRIECPGDVELIGRVFEVRGPSKRPQGEKPTKVDDSYSELQLDVSSWRCL